VIAIKAEMGCELQRKQDKLESMQEQLVQMYDAVLDFTSSTMNSKLGRIGSKIQHGASLQ
jgi:hypothetical protein